MKSLPHVREDERDNWVISIDLVMSAPRARGRKDLCGFFEFGQASQPYPMPPTGPHWAEL